MMVSSLPVYAMDREGRSTKLRASRWALALSSVALP